MTSSLLKEIAQPMTVTISSLHRLFTLCEIVRIFYTFYVLDNSGINEGTYLNQNTVDLPWSCDFGFSTDDSDLCGFKNDDLDEANFVENSGETPTIGTGPPDTESSQHGVLFNHLPSPPPLALYSPSKAVGNLP